MVMLKGSGPIYARIHDELAVKGLVVIGVKREGRLAAIDGVHALVPYISGLYGASAKTREAALPSLVENDGYFMGCGTAAIMAEVYDPGAEHATDPALLALSRDRRGPLRAAAARPLCHP